MASITDKQSTIIAFPNGFSFVVGYKEAGQTTYFTVLPIVLICAAVTTYVLAHLVLGTWSEGPSFHAILATMCFQMYFLPWLLLLVALWLPSLLPWVDFRAEHILDLSGDNSIRKFLLIIAAISLTGLPTLTQLNGASDAAVFPFLCNAIVSAAIGPLIVFGILVVMLAFPDLDSFEE